jgi:hypothetical protein
LTIVEEWIATRWEFSKSHIKKALLRDTQYYTAYLI